MFPFIGAASGILVREARCLHSIIICCGILVVFSFSDRCHLLLSHAVLNAFCMLDYEYIFKIAHLSPLPVIHQYLNMYQLTEIERKSNN